MSKLHNLYIEYKEKDSKKIYLFKNGNFYICLGDDALKLNKDLDLKLTNFTNEIVKCGFPVNQLTKYIKFISLLGYEYEIIYTNVFDTIINNIINTDDNINEKEALEKIKYYKELLIKNEK